MPNGIITREDFDKIEDINTKLGIVFESISELRIKVNRYAKIWGLIGGAIPSAVVIVILFLADKF